MTEDDFADLHTYRQEVARGLVHTHEWRARMEHRQSMFDWHAERIYRETHGITAHMPPPPPRIYLPPATEERGIPFGWSILVAAVVAFAAAAIVTLVLL